MKYDVVIVGAGPAGYFCAYELMQKNPNLKVILLDKGYDIYSRKCPILMHKLTKCTWLLSSMRYDKWFWWSRCLF